MDFLLKSVSEKLALFWGIFEKYGFSMWENVKKKTEILVRRSRLM